MEDRSLKGKLVTALFSRFPFFAERWAKGFRAVTGGETPWAPFTKEMNRCKVAIVTTAGVHLKNQVPFDMIDEHGDFSFRDIPGYATPDDLMITHKYYDHNDADRDMNIVFPLERLREMESAGEIGGVAHRHFGFMGHITDEKIEGLLQDSAPQVAQRLAADGADFVLLTPG